ncbi:MAG: tRNA (adenosine(37)-N6)-threonylcarbamoyltransferase complex ATPase subunit type 1 TsaE [Pseudomonadota bacterium]
MTRPVLTANYMLATEAETGRLGRALAPDLVAGDCVCLFGPLGAGKTALARALIQARLGDTVEVPSPSYTLVNVYAAPVEIWHADLYRLTGPEEVDELGLLDALSHAILLIEWPDRLGEDLPERRLDIELSHLAQGRRATLSAQGQGWHLPEAV